MEMTLEKPEKMSAQSGVDSQETIASDTKTIIQMALITKSYEMGTQVVHALRGVNLEIYEGEFVAIMGPSGSGKSTLMRTIATLQDADQGTVFLDDLDVQNNKHLVPNGTAVFVWLAIFMSRILM